MLSWPNRSDAKNFSPDEGTAGWNATGGPTGGTVLACRTFLHACQGVVLGCRAGGVFLPHEGKIARMDLQMRF